MTETIFSETNITVFSPNVKRKQKLISVIILAKFSTLFNGG